MISVLVPSRGRPEALAQSVASLGGGAGFEVLVRVDEDDPRLEDYRRLPGIELVVGPHHGYGALQLYYNELAQRARGEWLVIWNDDCMMDTAGWLDVVRRFDGKMAVLNPDTNHDNWSIDMNVFPIFPRRMVELIGHVSQSPHNDSWIEFLGRDAGIMVRVPIRVLHDRADLTGNNDDETYARREILHDEFHSGAMAELRARDTRLILDWLEQHPDARPDTGSDE